jgi:hypothetical protein
MLRLGLRLGYREKTGRSVKCPLGTAVNLACRFKTDEVQICNITRKIIRP